MASWLRFFLDIAPLAAFFAGYKAGGLMLATALTIAVTCVCLATMYALTRKISVAPLVTALVVAFFGGLTLYLQDERFIKMKPTIVSLLFAAILLGGVAFNKPTLRYVFAEALALTEEGWRKLTVRWGMFFVALAAMNEIIWRAFPTDIWVDFKVFGMFALTALFALAQWPLMKKHAAESDGAPR